MAKPTATRRPRKRDRKNVSTGVVHIKSSFNNTIVSITDTEGNVIAWASSGAVGYKGSRKSTPFAAQLAAEKAGRAAMEHGLKRAEVQVKGPGSGRDTAVRSIQQTGIEVTSIKDVTPVPHNGCRQPKRRARADKGNDRIMARYTGPKVRISRRLGTNIFENEKGRKALDRRPFPPGQHGRTRRRNAGSEYLAQMQEKQKAKYIYGVLEKQFRKTYEEAIRLQGPTGEILLRLLEQRLDNVVYRAGWASSRPQARQFVNHGLILVDGKRVDIASFRCKKGQVVSLSPKAQKMIVVQHNIDTLDRSVVGWLEAGDGGKQVTVRSLPEREHIDVPVRESLIVELYSK